MGLFEALVDEGARPHVFHRNETMCSPLRPAHSVYLIDYGYAREYTPAGDREAVHDLRGDGDIVGELAFWSPADRVKVDALTEVRAWPIDLRRLREQAAAAPAVATALVQELFARNLAARRHEALARAPVAARLAVWLLHLDERYGLASESAPPLSMETLADLVGSSPDVVQRQLTQWTQRGWLVRPGYRRLRIADPVALRAAAGSWEHLSAPWKGRVTPFLTRPGGPAPNSAVPVREMPKPRQLPADVSDFTGRQQSLDLLTDWLDRPRRTNTMVVQGLPGVGKTALVTRWAHQHADRFPDGQIVIDLRGQSPSQPPMTVAEALGQILRSLGVGEHMPASDEAELMLLYRSRIAGRRLLLVLDNAADATQVRALLPGGKDCVALVTSRTRMGPLRATGHADLMDLGVLDPGNAVALLIAVLGKDSPRAADRDALAELARVCSYHPFALRISAAKLAEDPGLSVQGRVGELRKPDRLLVGDPEEAFRSALDLAYESLSPAQRRAFRHVGLLPGRDFTPEVLAAALGAPVEDAVAALAGLHRAYLVEPLPGSRYRVHDLVKRLARELGRHAEAGVREARARLLDHYLAVAADPATPGEWFEAERRSLVSAVRMAGESGAHGMAWRLAAAVFEPFRRLRYYENDLEVQQGGLASAMQVSNRRAIALMRGNLGSIHRDIGPSTLAARFIGEALADHVSLGDREGQARALNDLAEVHGIAGNSEQALRHATEALALYEEIGDQAGVASCLHTLSRLHLSQERHEPALRYAGQALDVREQLGDRRGTAQSLIILATVQRNLGEPNAALSEGLEALSICHELGDEHAEAETLLCLAEIYDLLRLPHDARRDAERALAGYTATGDQYGCGRALCALGRIARNGSRYDEALSCYEQALAVQVELHHEQGRAETLGDIGLVYWRLADYRRADDYLNQALAISRVINDEPVEARMLNRLARVRRRQGRPQVAFTYALEALDIVQGKGIRRAEADVQETLAYTYLSLGQHRPALRAAKAALAIREELRDNRASALLSVAQALHAAGRPAAALEPARETVELQHESGTRDRWAAALTTLAMILLDLDRAEEALPYARQARDVHQECGTRRDLGCASRALGLVSARLGRQEAAVAHLREAVRTLEEVGDLVEARRAAEELRVFA